MESGMSGTARTGEAPPVLQLGFPKRHDIFRWLVGLLAYARKFRGRRDFPSLDNSAWHLFLYKLSKRCSCFEELAFDWVGPYPRCRQFPELKAAFLFISHGVSPAFDRLTVLELFLDRYRNYIETCDEIPPDEAVRIAEECGFWG